ncbi:MAG: DUF1566 domain-containing protein [Taibaiella sp.]|nr:DUF1566 domain-containing protein [Taibaiella sp.]
MKYILTIAALALIGLLTITGCKKKKSDPIVATVSTTVVTNVTDTSCLTGGNVTSDGGAAVTAKGVCWDTTNTPTVALTTKTNDGTGIGSYVSNIAGLSPGKTYYVRAYATNSAGTAYGTAEKINTTTITVPVLASLLTASVTSITQTSATCGGNVVSDGGFEVVARGVCWSTSSNPTVDLSTKTTDGADIGNFTSSITGLTLGTTYYVRAYATNSAGVAYGSEVTFTTSGATLASLSTTSPSSITLTSAVCGGVISNDGGAAITMRGICWSTSVNPTTALATKTAEGPGFGTFISNMTGLTPGTTYYVRAYATNSAGTSYGTQRSFYTTSLAVGMSYGGGKVAYILQPWDPGYVAGVVHGLIAAAADQSTGTGWGCSSIDVAGTSTALGSGQLNTNLIIAACAPTNAATICADLVTGGYSDWYLPSKDELNKLYLNRVAIGGFVNAWYRCSSQSSSTYAWEQSFSSGTQTVYPKTDLDHVRAVRSF